MTPSYVNLPVLLWVKAIVFIDFLAVALVVPVLPSYFKDAGIDSKSYGLLSSVYSISQLFGSIILGFCSDALSKRSILLISFLGSAISYSLMGITKNIVLLYFSRFLVGTVKQTISTSTLLITQYCGDNEQLRTKELARLNGIASVSFVIGPVLGGILYKMAPRLPANLACALFLLNILVCIFCCSESELSRLERNVPSKPSPAVTPKCSCNTVECPQHWATHAVTVLVDFWQISCSRLNYIVLLRLGLIFVQSSMTSRYIYHYYEDRFGIETYQLGFITSFATIVSILSELLFVEPVLKLLLDGGQQKKSIEHNSVDERHARVEILCLIVLIVSSVAESLSPNLPTYLISSLLPFTVAGAVLSSATRSVFISTVPPPHLGKVLGVFNAAVTLIGVISPLYGSHLFALFGSNVVDDCNVSELNCADGRPSTAASGKETSVYLAHTVGGNIALKGVITALHYSVLLVAVVWYTNMKYRTKIITGVSDTKSNEGCVYDSASSVTYQQRNECTDTFPQSGGSIAPIRNKNSASSTKESNCMCGRVVTAQKLVSKSKVE